MASGISTLLPPGSRVVALDTEASGLFVDEGARVSVVTLAWYDYSADENDPQIVSRCFAFDHGPLDKELPAGFKRSLFDDDAPNLGLEEWCDLVEWLQQQQLIAHNVKYDLHIMAAGHRKWGLGVDLSNRVVWDTNVVSFVMFPNQSTALKLTATRLWGEKEAETEKKLQVWLKKNKVNGNPRYDLAPWDLVGPYATKDAELCLRLWNYQTQLIDEGELDVPFSVVDREIDLAICLYRMESRGVGYDSEASLDAAHTLRTERVKVRQKLEQMGMRPVTEAGARRWFFDVCKAEPIEVTPGGKPSVNAESVLALAVKGVPGAAEYQAYNAYDDALSRYYEAWPAKCGADGRLRPSYHQVKAGGMKGQGRGTISGRLSVERVQLHAIPHDFRLPQNVPSVRSFFRAKPGHVLYEIDISQAEVRVATCIAHCEPMLEVLTSGDDVHGGTATQVFGINPGDEGWSMYRTLAKRLTFATIYGAGPKTFQQTLRTQANLDIPYAEAKGYLDDYRATFPEFRKLYFHMEYLASSKGYVQLVSGRLRHFSPYERDFMAHKAMNQLIQGNVADAMKIIKVEVEFNYPGILINEIHDSLMLEVPEGAVGLQIVEEVKALMVKILTELFGHFPNDKTKRIPWAVDAKEWNAA